MVVSTTASRTSTATGNGSLLGSLTALLWLAVITGRYVDTVRNALLHPFNKGADGDWALTLVALMAAQTASILVWRLKAVRLWFQAGVVFALAAVVMSGAAGAVLSAFLVMVSAALWGNWLLNRLSKNIPKRLAAGETTVLSFSLGLTFLAFGGLGLAVVGFLTSTAVWLFVGLSLMVHWRAIYSFSLAMIESRRVFERDKETGSLVVIVGLVFLLNLIWALVPEIQFDANNYHLAVAKTYIQHGRIIDLPNFFHSYFFHMLDMVIALCLALGGPIAAKILILFTGLLASLAAYSLGSTVFGHTVGVWSAVLFYTTGIVSSLSGTVHVDVPLTLFVTTSLLAFVYWQKSQDRFWLWITAILVGASVAVKLQALYVLPGMMAADLWLHRKDLSSSKAYSYIVAGLIGASIAAPWYGIVYAFTANPVFPLYNDLFKSPLWPFENTLPSADQFGLGTAPSALARLPFRITFDTGRFGEGLPRGSLGIGILLLFPVGLVMGWKQSHSLSLLVISSSALAFWAFTFQYVRYYVSILPLILCLGVAVFFRLARYRWMSSFVRLCLLVLVAAQVAVTPAQFWNIPERFPIFRTLGFETDSAFLARALGGYDSSIFLNSVLQPDERILGVEMEGGAFLLERPA